MIIFFSVIEDCIGFRKTNGLESKQITKVLTEMKSSDYEHLILTFDKHFGWHVTLEFDVHPSSKVRK